MLSRPAPDAGEAGVGERVRQAVGADVTTSAHRLRCPGRLTLAGAKQVRVGLRAQGGLDPRRGCDGESHEAASRWSRSWAPMKDVYEGGIASARSSQLVIQSISMTSPACCTDAGFRPRVPPLGRRNSCCLLYTSPSPRDGLLSRMPSSA